MVRTGGNIPTAGKLSAGKLTGAMLQKTLRPHLHPNLEKDMQGAGLFNKLAGIINMGNIKRLYGAIDKGIQIGTKGYSAYRDIKKGVDGMKKKDEAPMDKQIQELQLQQMSGAGLKKSKSSKSSKRKLPEALRKRAEFLGQKMREGHSMKSASDMYKSQK